MPSLAVFLVWWMGKRNQNWRGTYIKTQIVTDYRYHVRCHLMTHYRAFCHRMSHYLFLLPIHYLLPTEWQCRPGGQLGNSYKLLLALLLAYYHLFCIYSPPNFRRFTIKSFT